MGTLVRSVRWPRLFAAVFAAALILGLAAPATSLFLASASNAMLAHELELIGPTDAGLTAQMLGATDRRLFENAQRALYDELTPIDELGEPTATILGPRVTLLRRSAAEGPRVRLFYRDGALGNVTRLEGDPGARGVWVDDITAGALGLNVGDDVVVDYINGRTATSVAGIYRSLAAEPLSAYWRPLMFSIINPRSNDLAPPPFLIATKQTFFQIGERAADETQLIWNFPLERRNLDHDSAVKLESEYGRAHHAAGDPSSPLGRAMDEIKAYTWFATVSIDSLFFSLMDRLEGTRAALDSSTRVVAIAGQVVALLAIGGAGIFVGRRRRNEMRLLLAQGVSPTGIGARVALEMALPTVLGLGCGAVLSFIVVRALGPSDALKWSELMKTVDGIAVAGAAALVVLLVVTASTARRELETGTSRMTRAIRRTPWEVPVLVLAVVGYYEIATGRGAVVAEPGDVPQVDVFILAFPLLLISGLIGLGVRGLKRVLPAARTTGSGLALPLYLAWRRLSSASAVALMLLALAAVASGVLIYSATLVGSLEETIYAKAHVATGSDVSIDVTSQAKVPDAPFSVTRVTRTRADLLPGDVEVHVLGIDPGTFADTAFWDDSFSDRPLEELISDLSVDSSRLPILVSGVEAAGRLSMRAANTEIPVEVVAAPSAFPGMTLNTPVVVADREDFERVVADAGAGSVISVVGTPEIWGRGDPEVVRSYFEEQGLATGAIRDSRAFAEIGDLRAVAWTFSLMQALGLMAASIVLVGLLFYVEARQREEEVSYGLARRMGLTSRSHWAALTFEVMSMLVIAVILGEVAGLTASRLVLLHTDPLPAMPPAAVFRTPVGLALGLLPAVVVVAAAAAWRVQRRADRVRMAEVLRVAT